MGLNHCFVPGCKTGYPTVRKHNRMRGIKNLSLFGAHSVEQLEEWKKYIPRADRAFTLNDSVCELHFLKEDVIKYYETKISDGTIHRLERGRYKLREDAVPLIYPCLPNYLLEAVEMRRKRIQNCSFINDAKMQQRTENTLVTQKSSMLTEVRSQQKVGDSLVYPPKFELISDVKMHQVSEDPQGNLDFDVNKPLNTFTYSELTESIDCIVKPNMLWGITCHELFVMCALWDVNGDLQVRVIISRNMEIKVLINGETIFLKNELTCVEDVSALLAKINGDIVTNGTTL